MVIDRKQETFVELLQQMPSERQHIQPPQAARL
jgi:hypothetical protein